MELNENQTIMLDDKNKYWIVKKRNIDGILFYFTIKNTKPPQIVVLSEIEDELKIIDDEKILQIAALDLADTLTESQN